MIVPARGVANSIVRGLYALSKIFEALLHGSVLDWKSGNNDGRGCSRHFDKFRMRKETLSMRPENRIFIRPSNAFPLRNG